jgi:D-tyrosyl-tRNA(Tyr) deacylase
MKVLIQRVNQASVVVENEIVGNISNGLLLFVCFEQNDQSDFTIQMAQRIAKLRIFEDENKKMNLDLLQSKGSILSISQFTLAWDGSGGNRPSFDKSLHPTTARLLYHQFNKELKNMGIEVKEGIFGADMQVSLVNDGPVTFMLEFPLKK